MDWKDPEDLEDSIMSLSTGLVEKSDLTSFRSSLDTLFDCSTYRGTNYTSVQSSDCNSVYSSPYNGTVHSSPYNGSYNGSRSY